MLSEHICTVITTYLSEVNKRDERLLYEPLTAEDRYGIAFPCVSVFFHPINH